MEELCREMAERNMTKPLFVGGATTSALHTAVKLAPLYGHVFHSPDASSAAVMAKKYMMDPEGFENDEHKRQEEVRNLYYKGEETSRNENMEEKTLKGFAYETYPEGCPSDISAQQIPAEEILPYFDWKMFYAIWGVRYGSSSMEAMELVQLRRDAEDEISLGNFRIMLSAKFFPAYRENDDIVISDGDAQRRIPMMRQEKGVPYRHLHGRRRRLELRLPASRDVQLGLRHEPLGQLHQVVSRGPLRNAALQSGPFRPGLRHRQFHQARLRGEEGAA